MKKLQRIETRSMLRGPITGARGSLATVAHDAMMLKAEAANLGRRKPRKTKFKPRTILRKRSTTDEA